MLTIHFYLIQQTFFFHSNKKFMPKKCVKSSVTKVENITGEAMLQQQQSSGDKHFKCLCKSESFRALVDCFQQVGPELIIRLVGRQVQLVEAGVG